MMIRLYALSLNRRRLIALLLGFRRSISTCDELVQLMQRLEYALSSSFFVFRRWAYDKVIAKLKTVLKDAKNEDYPKR